MNIIAVIGGYTIFLRIVTIYHYDSLAVAKSNTDHYEHFFLNLFRGCIINYYLQQHINYILQIIDLIFFILIDMFKFFFVTQNKSFTQFTN